MKWNLIAAVLGIVAGLLTAAAAGLLCYNDPSLINGLASAAGVVGTLCGIAWTMSAVKER
jgi:hypothetical protein